MVNNIINAAEVWYTMIYDVPWYMVYHTYIAMLHSIHYVIYQDIIFMIMLYSMARYDRMVKNNGIYCVKWHIVKRWHYSCRPAHPEHIHAQLFCFLTRQVQGIAIVIQLESPFASQPSAPIGCSGSCFSSWWYITPWYRYITPSLYDIQNYKWCGIDISHLGYIT